MVDRSVIIARMLDKISTTYDKSEGSVIRDMLMPMAIAAEDLTVRADEIIKNSMFDTAEGEHLDDVASEIGVFRQEATHARGTVTFYGDVGTMIPLGTYIKSDEQQYTTLSTANVGSDGKAVVPVMAVNPGKVGNCIAGFVNSLNINMLGIDSVKNEEDITGGADVESDELLRKKVLYYAQHPIYAGNAAQYTEWAENASAEVGRAKCIPVWNGPGTVKVIFVKDDGSVPNASLIGTVSTAIESQMPCVGITLTVSAPSEKAITVTIKVSEEPSEDIQTSVKESIEAYLRSIALAEDVVHYSRVCAAVLEVSELSDFTELTVSGAFANVSLAEDEIPVLSVVEFEVSA